MLVILISRKLGANSHIKPHWQDSKNIVDCRSKRFLLFISLPFYSRKGWNSLHTTAQNLFAYFSIMLQSTNLKEKSKGLKTHVNSSLQSENSVLLWWNISTAGTESAIILKLWGIFQKSTKPNIPLMFINYHAAKVLDRYLLFFTR